MFGQMEKLEEFLIVKNEIGDIGCDTTTNTEVIAQYKTIGETLVFLKKLNYKIQRMFCSLNGAGRIQILYAG